MNPAILQTYIGPDIKGRQVAGIIRHVAGYTKGSVPTGYVLQQYIEGRSSGIAIISAQAVKAHLDGLELVASMEGDKE